MSNKQYSESIFSDIENEVRTKAKISEKKFCELLKIKKEDIIKCLCQPVHQDVESENVSNQAKRKIYKGYIDQVAQLISKLEVYESDLNKTIANRLFDLFTAVAISQNSPDDELLSNNALNVYYVVKHTVNIRLAKVYIKRIKEYRRMIRNFNHQGIECADGVKFDDEVNQKYKELKLLYKAKYQIYQNIVDEKKEFYRETEEFIGLEELVEKAEYLLGLYESKFSNVVGNGYNNTGPHRIFGFLLWLVPLGLAVATIVIYILKYV